MFIEIEYGTTIFLQKCFYPKKKLFWGFIRKIIQMAAKRFNFLKEKFRDIVRQYKLYPNSLEVFVSIKES